MTAETVRYALKRTVKLSWQEADRRVRAALQDEGFGILTEIDVQATLKKKLNVDFRRYEILGACNPPLAHRALEAEPDVGLLLPCTVVVQESAAGVVVEALDPVVQLEVSENPDLVTLARDVRALLERALDRVAKDRGTP